ncbi:MAG: retron system putative HNH endonuclease [Clostridia bacterium]
MLNIIKRNAPEELNKFIKYYNPKDWDDYTPEIKQILKKYMLDEEQFYSCAYCEVKITDPHEAHIEHIKPKSVYMTKFQKYDNLIVSCNTPKHCGNAKGNTFSDLFINPVVDNPEDFLTYDLADGRIIPKTSDPNIVARANETIDMLNLNSVKLKKARKNYILSMQYYEEDYLEEMINNHDRFYTLIKCFKLHSF